jgi:hypothetical protein
VQCYEVLVVLKNNQNGVPFDADQGVPQGDMTHHHSLALSLMQW